MSRRGGFAILFVVAIVFMAMLVLGVFASACHTMAWETDRRASEANRCNLEFSARAWARQRQAAGQAVPADGRELDVSALGIRGGELTVSTSPEGALQATTTCRRLRKPQTLTRTVE